MTETVKDNNTDTGDLAMCRGCLQYSPRKEVHPFNEETTWIQFMVCTSIAVSKNDIGRLPYQLCSSCWRKCCALTEFRKMCQESDQKLQRGQVTEKPPVEDLEDIIIYDEEEDEEPSRQQMEVEKTIPSRTLSRSHAIQSMQTPDDNPVWKYFRWENEHIVQCKRCENYYNIENGYDGLRTHLWNKYKIKLKREPNEPQIPANTKTVMAIDEKMYLEKILQRLKLVDKKLIQLTSQGGPKPKEVVVVENLQEEELPTVQTEVTVTPSFVHSRPRAPLVRFPLKSEEEVDALIKLIENDPEKELDLINQFTKVSEDKREKAIRSYFTDNVLALYTKTGSTTTRSTHLCPIFQALKYAWVDSSFDSVSYESFLTTAIAHQRSRARKRKSDLRLKFKYCPNSSGQEDDEEDI